MQDAPRANRDVERLGRHLPEMRKPEASRAILGIRRARERKQISRRLRVFECKLRLHAPHLRLPLNSKIRGSRYLDKFFKFFKCSGISTSGGSFGSGTNSPGTNFKGSTPAQIGSE